MIGYGSVAVNDQLVPVPVQQAYNPLTFGQAYTGPAYWPRQGVYNVPPVLPSAALQSSQAPIAYGNVSTLPSNSSEKGSPFHPTKSPLWMALIFLVGGLAMLHYIHYK